MQTESYSFEKSKIVFVHHICANALMTLCITSVKHILKIDILDFFYKLYLHKSYANILSIQIKETTVSTDVHTHRSPHSYTYLKPSPTAVWPQS